MAEPKRWHIDIPGTRIDAFPWRINVLEFAGTRPGPATAVLSGITGDKPLGVIAMHHLARDLAGRDMAGTVLVIPCANPYGFQGGTRHDPSLVELNRRFPGVARGMISDQIAHALMTMLKQRVDAILDIHSGTAVRTTEYIYDYGNLDLSASFAYLPVMVNRAIPGQLCTAAQEAGMKASLVEFGGPDRNDPGRAVAGCLNMLRYRGHLDDAPTGPDEVAVIDRVKITTASRDGILESRVGPADVGKPLASGDFAWITNVVTGERLETFTAEAIGDAAGGEPEFASRAGRTPGPFTVTEPPLLLLAQSVPSLVSPGNLLFITGWAGQRIATPRR